MADMVRFLDFGAAKVTETITRTPRGRAVIEVAIVGTFDGFEKGSSGDLQYYFTNALATSAERVVVLLARTTHYTELAPSLIERLRTIVRARGGDVVLAEPSPRVAAALRLLGESFTVSEEAALVQLDRVNVPVPLDEFLDWFREATERAWTSYSPRDPLDPRLFGPDWQPGTRWKNGLSEDEIGAVEERWRVRFPPDYRLFLRKLHTVDRPEKLGAFQGSERVVTTRPSFFDWQSDLEPLTNAFAVPLEGVLFDIENGLWPESWGPAPASLGERLSLARGFAAEAAPLIPVIGHRYLVGTPVEAGNPVLSFHQTDIIVYGRDLRTFLLTELSDLLGAEKIEDHSPAPARQVPFWGQFVE